MRCSLALLLATACALPRAPQPVAPLDAPPKDCLHPPAVLAAKSILGQAKQLALTGLRDQHGVRDVRDEARPELALRRCVDDESPCDHVWADDGSDIPAGFLPPTPPLPRMSDDEYDRMQRQQLSAALGALCEPPLAADPGSAGSDAYRVTVSRSFRPPVAVRLEIDESGHGVLTATVGLDGPHDEAIGKSTVFGRRLRVAVSPDEARQFLAALDAADYWNLSGTADTNFLYSDGSEWFLEARRDGTYRVVARMNPRSTAFAAAGRWLLDRAGLPDVR